MLLCFGLLFSLTFGEQWVQHKGTLYAIDSFNGGTYDDDRDQNANDMRWWRPLHTMDHGVRNHPHLYHSFKFLNCYASPLMCIDWPSADIFLLSCKILPNNCSHSASWYQRTWPGQFDMSVKSSWCCLVGLTLSHPVNWTYGSLLASKAGLATFWSGPIPVHLKM